MAIERLGGGEGRIESYEDRKAEALRLAQALSHKWLKLPAKEKVTADARGRIDMEVRDLYRSKGGKTEIQRLFEHEMKHIEEGGYSLEDKDTLLRRLIVRLEAYEEEVDRIIGNSKDRT